MEIDYNSSRADIQDYIKEHSVFEKRRDFLVSELSDAINYYFSNGRTVWVKEGCAEVTIWGVNGMVRFDLVKRVDGVIDYGNPALKRAINSISAYWSGRDAGIVDELFLSVAFKKMPDCNEIELIRTGLEEILKSKE